MTAGFRTRQPVAIPVAQPVAPTPRQRFYWSEHAEGAIRPTAHLNSSIVHVFRSGGRP